jgi:hypothetical protein
MKPWLKYLAFATVASLYMFPFMRFTMMGSDEGILLVEAERIVNGQVYARDFFPGVGPGTLYLLAGWFKVVGVSFIAARIYLFLTLLATGGLVFFLSRRLCGKLWLIPCALLMGTYLGLVSSGVSHHFDANLYALLAVVCMIFWRQKRTSFLLIVSGVCLGISTCILQHKGMLLLCAILAWILVRRKQEPGWLLAAIFVFTSYLATLGVERLYFYREGALQTAHSDGFIASRLKYESVNSVTYAHGLFGNGIFDFWSALFRHTIWGNVLSVGLILPDLLIVSLPLIVVLLGIKYRSKTNDPEILLLWFTGYALFLSECQRTDLTHLLWGSPLLIVLFAHLLDRSRTAIGRAAGDLINISAIFLAICTFLVVLFGAKTVVTRRGSIAVLEQSAPGVLRFLDKETKPGEEIFVYPYSPLYYFLSGTRNATRYSSLIYGFNASEQLQEVTHVLDESRIRIVVWDTNFVEKNERQAFPGAPHPRPDQLIIEPYLMSHYRLVDNYDGVWIMERMPEKNNSGRATNREQLATSQ